MEEKYLHALNIILRPGNTRLEALISHFGSATEAWHASENDILFCPTLSQDAKDLLRRNRSMIDPDKEWHVLRKSGVSSVAKPDPGYPAALREIPDAPYLLYARGAYDFSSPRPLIAIVGSRKYTSYGEQAAYRIGSDLAQSGCTVVSGLAFGIDALAHHAALEAGAETIAVMGNGLDDASLYPRTNVALARKIAGHGALLSEYPPDTKANSYTFPARNRIIAGLSIGTVVIEAAEESGSLITARLALDYGREVFAVPGSIFSPVSVGTHRLIREGAKIVTSVRDILDEFPQTARPAETEEPHRTPEHPSLSPEEKQVLACLSHEPLHIDKIVRSARLETSQTSGVLAMLEIKGIVRNIGGMNYIRMQM